MKAFSLSILIFCGDFIVRVDFSLPICIAVECFFCSFEHINDILNSA